MLDTGENLNPKLILDKIILLTPKMFSLSHYIPATCAAYSSPVKNGFEISSIPSFGLTNDTCVPRMTTKPSLRVALVVFSMSVGSVEAETRKVSFECIKT
jgi:maleate cis-trans isomerase